MSENRNKGSTEDKPVPAPTGRPRIWNDPEAMQEMIDSYFNLCDLSQRPYTIPGLAYHLGFSSRQVLWDYEQNPRFHDTVKRAKLRVEGQRNEQLLSNKTSAPGAIFDLKNNFGWQDVQVVKNEDDNRDERELMASFTALIHQLAPILVANQPAPIRVIEATVTPRNDTETILNLDDYRKE